jgi:hypothetical protein
MNGSGLERPWRARLRLSRRLLTLWRSWTMALRMLLLSIATKWLRTARLQEGEPRESSSKTIAEMDRYVRGQHANAPGKQP